MSRRSEEQDLARSLYNFSGVVGLLGGPVPERRPEAMGHCRDPMLRKQSAQPLAVHRSPALADEHDGTVPVLQPPGCLENLQRALAQRHPMLPCRLHPACWNRPHARTLIHLAPHRPTDLAAPRRRQHQELER